MAKILVLLGTLIVFLSDAYALWNFRRAFNSIKSGEAAGIGAFAAYIDSAYFGVLLSFVGIAVLFAGCLLLLILKPKPAVAAQSAQQQL